MFGRLAADLNDVIPRNDSVSLMRLHDAQAMAAGVHARNPRRDNQANAGQDESQLSKDGVGRSLADAADGLKQSQQGKTASEHNRAVPPPGYQRWDSRDSSLTET